MYPLQKSIGKMKIVKIALSKCVWIFLLTWLYWPLFLLVKGKWNLVLTALNLPILKLLWSILLVQKVQVWRTRKRTEGKGEKQKLINSTLASYSIGGKKLFFSPRSLPQILLHPDSSYLATSSVRSGYTDQAGFWGMRWRVYLTSISTCS